MVPYELKTLRETVRKDIQLYGFRQTDRRMERTTQSLTAYRLPIEDGNLIRWLKKEKPADKFKDDWERIKPWFDLAVENAKIDIDSRQLVLFNDKDYGIAKQCFTQMQFARLEDTKYTIKHPDVALIVTQRSGDMAKFDDDLVFFGSVSAKFEKATKHKVRSIIVNYSHVHYQLDK